MTQFASTPCKVVALGLMILSSSVFAQNGLVDTNQSSPALNHAPALLESEAVIVDSKSKSHAFPSMEEEMDMYMKLQSETPQVYFFPNPSSGVIWLEHNLGNSCTVRIIDSSDRVMFTAKNMQVKKLDLSEFPAGAYTLEASNGSEMVFRSLIVR